MTDKITLELTLDELKLIDKYVELNDETESVFDKIRDAYPKSPVEEAYKDWMGNYPPTTPSVDGIDDIRWRAFQMGYNAAYEEKVSEWEPTPQTPEQVSDGLREAFREAIKNGIIPEVKQPTDDLIDKLTKNPPEFLKFELGPNLYDLIEDWWSDIFTAQSDMDMETSIYNLTERIEKWLPREQFAGGSQSLGVEDMVEGFNDALKKIKGKLR